MSIADECYFLPVEINGLMRLLLLMIYSLFDARIDVILKYKKNKTSYDALLKINIFYCDNQLDSGFAINLALLYAISSVKQVCP